MNAYKKAAYEQAIALRRRGFTYSEIAKFCNVSKATVSNWCRPEAFSKTVAEENQRRAVIANTKRLAVLTKARKTDRFRQYVEAERVAEIEYQHYRLSPQFMVGLSVYVSAGDVTHPHQIRLSSTRPELHRIFIQFCEVYLAVPKSDIRLWLLLYSGHDEAVCLRSWSKRTGIPTTQFHKHQRVASQSTAKPLHFGVGNTIIGSTLLKKKLTRWATLLLKESTK